MDLNSTNRKLFLVVSILLLSFNSNTSAAIQLISMQQIGVDTVGDGINLGYDILSAYAASVDGLLMLTVVYTEVGEWGLYSNTTLRNSNGDLFLIMVYTTSDNNYISLAGATSLEDDSLQRDDGSYFDYVETWRVHTNYTELTFFVDWMDIGGEGPVDIVFWTGRPLDNPDKLPNTGHLSFDGVKTVDTTGYLDDPTRTTITSIDDPTGEPDPSDPGSATTITVTEDPNNGEIPSNQTDTPEPQVEIQLTDLIPLSNTFILGLVVVYLGSRKLRKQSIA